MTKTVNSSLQHDVLEELEFDPSVDASQIGVTVKGGVVTLTGHVHNYTEKTAADRIAKRVHGVEAVANDIDVKLPIDAERDDSDLARGVADAIRWNVALPKDKIQVTVANGWVTLEGEVDWEYQRRVAFDAVRGLRAIHGVTNNISVMPKLNPVAVKEKIESALRRNAEIDARKISVETSGDRVILRGTVRSWVEREDAVNAAWSAPGVRRVVDELKVHAA
ncbi:MAG TPA: BON domain-containing protein [Thermoanaerobaculia bacterium]|nr:BON domain-containing protein [Thermoanaerobaculia bacterium]